MSPSRSRLRLLVPVLLLSFLAAACGSDKDEPGASSDTTGAGGEKVTLRLGYFPNVTHAPAMVGLENGEFADALGPNVSVKTSVFNAGPNAVEALFSNSIDVSFVGPNPAINSYAKSNGEATRVVAGTASGGAFFIVQPDIKDVADLKGKKVGTPQLGNTQDIALRYWLKEEGYETNPEGGGDVNVVPADNSVNVQAFEQGDISGAWLPEPNATKLKDAGGHVLVDERDLWPDGEYVTTVLIVRTAFLNDHPDVIKNLIKGLSASIDFINDNKDEAATVVSAGIEKATTKPIAVDLVTKSFESITFTLDPIASSLRTGAEHATELGLLDETDLSNIFDLKLVNEVLTEEGKENVKS